LKRKMEKKELLNEEDFKSLEFDKEFINANTKGKKR